MATGGGTEQAPAEAEPLELVLFQVAECYVYLVRPLALPPTLSISFMDSCSGVVSCALPVLALLCRFGRQSSSEAC